MLSHASMERFFGLPDKKVYALLTALVCIKHIVNFVFGVNQFLSQSVTGSQVNWDVKLRENSSGSLWRPCHIQNDNIVPFVLTFFLCCQGIVPEAVGGFDICPVRVLADF